MTSLTIFGAAGHLGRHLARRALAAGLDLTLVARTPHQFDDARTAGAQIVCVDLSTTDRLDELMSGRDAIINVAGNAGDGDSFCWLVARLVEALDSLPTGRRPRAWFMGGMGILEIGDTGLRGVDLPLFPRKFRTHDRNHKRLLRSSADWSLLCPGQLVAGSGVGGSALRVTIEHLPVEIPGHARYLPGPLLVPLLIARAPLMKLAYDDAADFLISHLDRDGNFLRRRIGLAAPSSPNSQSISG
jgi:putative NADH-flavin reductase